jgi:hypothetical protein
VQIVRTPSVMRLRIRHHVRKTGVTIGLRRSRHSLISKNPRISYRNEVARAAAQALDHIQIALS